MSECNDLTKHDRIMLTATDHFIKLGYANVTTEGIAKDAGVSKGLIFHHFNSKDDLAFEVFKKFLSIDAGIEQFIESFQNTEDTNKKDESINPIGLIKEFIRGTLNQMQSDPGLSLLFMDLLINVRNEEVRLKIKQLLVDYTNQLFELFKKLGIKNPELKARTTFAIIDGLGFQYYYMDKDQTKVTTDDFINIIMEILEK